MKTKQHFSDRVWQFFCSVKLTIYTLVLITVASIVGTLVLQDGSHAQYVSLYGDAMARVIQSTGINSIYRVWWFLGLLGLLCINIIVCSVERLSKTWKIIFPDRISIHRDRLSWVKDKRLVDSESTPESLETICRTLLKKRVRNIIRIEDKDGIILYGEKGRWSKMGVYVVHVSVVMLLLGALIGSVFGFKGTMKLEEGKKSHMVRSMESGSPIPLKFDIQCNRFSVSFYDTGAPKEYVSSLTLLKGDNILETREIRVNHPLRFQGINIFQSSYGEAPPSWAVFHIVDTKTGKTTTQKITRGESIPLPQGAGHFVFQGAIPNFRFMGRNLGQALVGIVHREGQKSVRIGLPTKFPTFDKIISALKLICKYLSSENTSISRILTVRINYDNQTLNYTDEIIKELSELDRDKVFIHLERVWQTKSLVTLEQIERLKKTILKFSVAGFKVGHGIFGRRSNSCPAEVYNYAVINYNGLVYRCNGRTLTPQTAEGELLPDGTIEWKKDMLIKRLSRSTFENEKCLNCVMLPQCMGPCSQKQMENGWGNIEGICSLNVIDLSIEDYLTLDFEVRNLIYRN